MKILIFSLVYYPRFIGGAEVAVKEITDRIPASEIEFDMITLRKHAPAFERIGNVNVYRVGIPWSGARTHSSKLFPLSKILYTPLAALKAFSLYRANRYDMTWSIMASYAGFAAVLFKIFHPRIPLVLTVQEGEHFGRREGKLKIFFSLIFKSAYKVQAISNFLAEWAKKMGARRSVSVIPNGVDISLFTKNYVWSELEDLKKSLGKNVGDVFLVTTSRLVEKNGVADVIEALPYLASHIKFVVVGTGELEQSLRDQAAKLGVAARVKFVGFVPHESMAKYLKVSDVFIRPSLTEGLGNSFIEAMGAGIPVIATPVGGIPDFLEEGKTGYFCEVENPKSIAETVKKVLGNEATRQHIIENAKKMVIEKYDWNFVAQRMKDEVLLK